MIVLGYNSDLFPESYGIECGRLAGLDDTVLERAASRSSALRTEVEQRLRMNRFVSNLLDLVTLWFTLHASLTRLCEGLNGCLRSSDTDPQIAATLKLLRHAKVYMQRYRTSTQTSKN